MCDETNGNATGTRGSTEDLSEYTDADESMSAPTEVLAEFLSAVMLKDYATALKYCKLILQYEPENATARDFHPLIVQKLRQDRHSPDPSSGSDAGDADASIGESDDEPDAAVDDDEIDEDDDDDDEDDEEEDDEDDDTGATTTSATSSASDARGGRRSDATTASYSSLEDDEVDGTRCAAGALDNADQGNGNTILPPPASSDSESPTEPVSQRAVALLRARVVPPRL